MKDTRLHYSLALCLIVILSLFLLSGLPEFSIGAWKFRDVDMLSSIRTELPPDTLIAQTDSIQNDSVQAKMDSVVRVVQSGCKEGITCIEDYSADSTALHFFLKALSEQPESNKPLRIAMYGDSFIEGDVLCGAIRDTLQTIFGGRGVGYVPLTSDVTGFRNTIKHAFENWKTVSLVSKKDSSFTGEVGPGGFCFLPQPGNWVEFKPSKQRYLREFSVIRLFYKNRGHALLEYAMNDTITDTIPLKTSPRLREWKYYDGKVRSARFQFHQADSLELYGASFEGPAGIYVDNFSLRGNSGIGLYNVSDNMYKEFNQYRDYKLIILQYGLNVVREDSMRYAWYASKMIRVINKLKRVFPEASILLMSVSDRGSNTTGELKTMKSISAMRNAQRYIARETGIAFWDLYSAMGGENSIIKFAKAKPALAAKDYTHLTFKGGRKLARLFVNSLLYEKEKYEEDVQLQ
jgi:hypothetical protein